MTLDYDAAKVAVAWHQLAHHRLIDASLLPPLVAASWQRSLAAGVDPAGTEGAVLPADLLARHRQLAALFLEEVRQVWETLPELPCGLLVADADGYLLDAYIADSWPPRAYLEPGTCWKEDSWGTNGLGTSLALRQPAIIQGAEHYRRCLHEWCSIGLPVWQQGDYLAGILGFLFPLDAVTSQTVALARVFGRAVEKGLQLTYHYQHAGLAELVVETTANAVMTVDRSGRITFINRAAGDLFGLTPGEVLGRRHVDIFHQGHTYTAGGEYTCKLTEALETGRAFLQLEKTYPHLAPNRVFSADAFPLYQEDGQIVGAMALYRDITAQKRAEAELAATKQTLEDLIVTDPVTGLFNRRYFEERLEEELVRARHFDTCGSLLLINVDYFRDYNERLGLEGADELLRQIGELIRAQLRPFDLLGRLTGDEFAVFLLDTTAQEGMQLSENIRQAVAHHNFHVPDLLRPVTVSVGLATYPTNATGKNDLIQAARRALSQAKRTSRNKVELYFGILEHLQPIVKPDDQEAFNTIRTLITVINAKDSYTYGHTERVVRYAAQLGAGLGLSATELHYLLYGAFLHDIGKIEIGRELLNKSTPLTPEEWEVLKKHPVWGAEIVEAVPLLVPISPLILYHHERYDGRGYPGGLRGADIPLLARILTVVDSFDAMTTDRPYKKARDLEQAMEELQQCQGSQFDPDIVRVFINILPRIAEELPLGR